MSFCRCLYFLQKKWKLLYQVRNNCRFHDCLIYFHFSAFHTKNMFKKKTSKNNLFYKLQKYAKAQKSSILINFEKVCFSCKHLFSQLIISSISHGRIWVRVPDLEKGGGGKVDILFQKNRFRIKSRIKKPTNQV